MATETKPNPVAQFGPIGAPALGALLLIGFIVAVQFSGSMSEEQGKLQKAAKDVNSRLGLGTAGLPPSGMPKVTSVIDMVTPDERKTYTPVPGEAKIANLPVVIKVEVEGREEDEFELYDEDKNGFWDEKEFRATPYYGQPGRVGKFVEWDNNPKDNRISRAEYNLPPKDEEELFASLDKDGNGRLTAPDEISRQDLLNWDEDFDDAISLQEFKDRNKPKEWVDLGPVKSVGVTVDLEKMEIVVSWEAPDLATMPPDATYLIERFSPETVEARKKEYGRRVAKYTEDLTRWEAAFDKWWNAPSDSDPEKTNKDVESNRTKALAAFKAISPEPIKPEEPAAWERYAEATGTEFRDVGFETDASYTYAVRMLTAKPLKRGVKHDMVFNDKKASARVVQPTHPVRVPNRVVMSWNGAAGANQVNIVLTRWYRYGLGQESVWYKVSMLEKVDNVGSPTLGGDYSAAQLKDRDGKATKAGETEAADLPTLLAGGAKINFSTGFRFVSNTNAGTILNHSELGDYELPRATRAPMPAQPAPSTASTLEVRVLAMTNTANARNIDASFEITRWHQVGDNWYRVVLTRKKVKLGEEAGASLDLNSAPAGVDVFDSSGNKLNAAAIRNLKAGTVDLTAGKFDGLDGRDVKVGADKLDIFGTLYR